MRGSVLMMLVAVAACGRQEPAESEPEKQGRVETQNIRNTDAIGYSGGAIADKVDAALDANDERKRQLEKAEQESSGE